jgi:hypothetical protein
MLEWWGPVLVSLRWQVRDFLFFFFFFCCCCCLPIVGSRRQLWAGIGGCSIDNCGDMSMEFVLSIDWVEAKQNTELMRQAAFFFPFCQWSQHSCCRDSFMYVTANPLQATNKQTKQPNFLILLDYFFFFFFFFFHFLIGICTCVLPQNCSCCNRLCLPSVYAFLWVPALAGRTSLSISCRPHR